jgi:hypothetical protein
LIDHPDIDAVAVSLRVPAHYEPTMAALNAGKRLHGVASRANYRRSEGDG